MRRVPVLAPSSVVQYVLSFSSTVLPGLYAVSFPRTLSANTEAPSAAARLSSNVSAMLSPNSSTLSRIALSTVPLLFGGMFRRNVALFPIDPKYMDPRSEMLFGVFFVVPQNHPDVMRASASGTVHWLPSSKPIVYPPFELLSILLLS